MSKKKRLPKPEWWLSAKDFRLASKWIQDLLSEVVASSGGEGIGASSIIERIASIRGGPDGYAAMDRDRRRPLVWSNARLLIDRKIIEEFRPRGSSYLHFRRVNVLDRLTYALRQE